MTPKYNGHYDYTQSLIQNWKYALIGVYYCGYINNVGNLVPLYIGRATGQEGIRGRLLDHLSDDYWPNVTHFGYHQCATAQQAINLEATQIKQLQPQYNIQGK